MSDNYCYTHMPETTGYCVYCDVDAKGKTIDRLEARVAELEATLQGIATMCRNEKTNLDVVCEVAADQAEQTLGEKE